jgi:hypothetical protein
MAASHAVFAAIRGGRTSTLALKRLIATLVLTAAMMVPAGAALAAPGGAPGAHGVDGRTFGSLVSDAARTDVGWLVSHVSGGRA